jgi:hypothetical protein
LCIQRALYQSQSLHGFSSHIGLIKFSEINQGPSKVRRKIAIGKYERLEGQGAIFKECFSKVI